MAGWNFRNTAGFLTDGAGDTYVLSGLAGTPWDAYPTVRNGETFGWTNASGAFTSGRDRTAAGPTPKLGGINFTANGSSVDQRDFRVDRTGSQDCRLGAGDNASGHTIAVDIRDSLGSKAVISGTTNADEFIDATNVKRTSSSDWNSNNAVLTASFTGHMIVRIGDADVGTVGTNTVISHFAATDTPAAGHPAAKRFGGVQFTRPPSAVRRW